MAGISGLRDALAKVAAESDPARAITIVTRAVLELTSSRNAILALMDDELGNMVLTHGEGEDWEKLAFKDQIRVDISQRQGIVGFVAASGGSIVVGDVQSEPRYRKLFESTVSELAVPIRDRGGRIRAVLNAESDRPNAYSEGDLRTCEALAALASLVIERAEMLKRERALLEVGRALDTATTEPELLEAVIRVAGEVLRFQACSIFLLDRKRETYVLRASIGELKDRIGQIEYRPGEGCTGWVCQTGKPVRLARPQSDPRWRGKYLEFPSDQIAGFLAVPLSVRGQCTGVIRVIRRTTVNPHLDNTFTQGDEELLLAIAEQVASGLENIRSFQKLMHSERMAAWGELSAKSSHMIGNRVFALKGDLNELAYRLSKDSPSLDELRELSDSLSANVRKIEEILQDFRDFVSATQLTFEEVDVNGLVRETLAEVFPKRSPVQLSLKLSKEAFKVQGDPRKLQRAVAELVENALIWTQEGKLEVETCLADEAVARAAGLRTDRRYVAIVVADTGPGVPLEYKSAIFQPFHSGRVKGMGLGLSIVKGIAEAHGGAAIETGESGSGAKFSILLPLPIRPTPEEA